MTAPVLVTARVPVLDAHGRQERRHVALVWCPREPHVVQLVFSPGPVWLLDRALLADGLHAPAGLGDVTVIPALDGPHLEVVLSPAADPDGPGERVAVVLPRAMVEGFVARTAPVGDPEVSGR